jgi:hypothetical protein
MILAKAKAKAKSKAMHIYSTGVTYDNHLDCQNIFLVQATGTRKVPMNMS